jgi:hypothetical protein
LDLDLILHLGSPDERLERCNLRFNSGASTLRSGVLSLQRARRSTADCNWFKSVMRRSKSWSITEFAKLLAWIFVVFQGVGHPQARRLGGPWSSESFPPPLILVSLLLLLLLSRHLLPLPLLNPLQLLQDNNTNTPHIVVI